MSPIPGTEQPEELQRQKVFDETSWLLYCCCYGCGIGRVGDPLVAAEVKELCCRSSLSTTDVMADDGLCNMTQVCICIVEQCQFPPLKQDNIKCCGCCGKFCGPDIGSKDWNDDLFKKDIMDETFWCEYICCYGCGIVSPMTQGIYSAQFKMCCCRGSETVEAPLLDGVACGQVSTCCCIWEECQCPPAKPSPQIAICTWAFKKGPYTPAESGPAQLEMK